MKSVRCLMAAMALLAPLGCRFRPFHSTSSSELRPTPRFNLDVDDGATIDVPALQASLSRTLERFEQDYWKVEAPLEIRVTGRDCLRTGYDFPTRAVTFCLNETVVAGGTRSGDVVAHEVFHALVCQKDTARCTTELLADDAHTALHEALADVFAASLDSTPFFGEDFVAEKPYLRKYASDLCYSLTAGAHPKGNAIASEILDAQTPVHALRDFVLGSTFSLEALREKTGISSPCLAPGDAAPRMSFRFEGLAPSALHRFRVPHEGAHVVFELNDAARRLFPDLSVAWRSQSLEAPAEFAMIAGDTPLRFLVKPAKERASEKVFAEYTAARKSVGFEVFYLSEARR